MKAIKYNASKKTNKYLSKETLFVIQYQHVKHDGELDPEDAWSASVIFQFKENQRKLLVALN